MTTLITAAKETILVLNNAKNRVCKKIMVISAAKITVNDFF